FGLDPTILNKQIIVNGKSLTIVGVSPKGFDGTTIGIRPAVFAPITLRAMLDTDTDWSLRTDYWAYLFARLRPGVRIAAPRVARRPVPRDPQRCRSAAAEGHQSADAGAFSREAHPRRAGRTRPELDPRRGEDAAPPVAWRHGVRAAHRLRQHCEPAARAIDGTRRRDGHPALDRLEPCAPRRTAPQRVVPAGGSRRTGRHGRRALDARARRLATAARSAAHDHLQHRRHRHPVRNRPDVRHEYALRAVPRTPQHAAGSRLDAQEP